MSRRRRVMMARELRSAKSAIVRRAMTVAAKCVVDRAKEKKVADQEVAVKHAAKVADRAVVKQAKVGRVVKVLVDHVVEPRVAKDLAARRANRVAMQKVANRAAKDEAKIAKRLDRKSVAAKLALAKLVAVRRNVAARQKAWDAAGVVRRKWIAMTAVVRPRWHEMRKAAVR